MASTRINWREAGLSPLLSPDDLTTLRAEIRAVTVEDGIMRYITGIAASDPHGRRSGAGRQSARLHCDAAGGEGLGRDAGPRLCRAG